MNMRDTKDYTIGFTLTEHTPGGEVPEGMVWMYVYGGTREEIENLESVERTSKLAQDTYLFSLTLRAELLPPLHSALRWRQIAHSLFVGLFPFEDVPVVIRIPNTKATVH